MIRHLSIQLILLSFWLFGVLASSATAAVGAVSAADAFDEANRLFEQGRFGAAADAYETVFKGGQTTVAVLFNLGNARLRNGEVGRAIAAYLQAQRLSPRDAGVLSNLQIARQAVKASEERTFSVRQRLLGFLTAGEWSAAAAAAAWLFFIALSLGEWRPSLRASLRLPSKIFGACLVLFLGAWMLVASDASKSFGVVVQKDAPVRFTPLEESPVSFNAPDGFELEVLGRKGGSGSGDEWVEVKDASGRIGWIRSRAVARVGFF